MLRKLSSLLRIMLGSTTNHARALYELMGPQRLIDPSNPHLSMGIEAGADRYGQACQRLVDELLEGIDLAEHRRVLDVGCGFGAATAYLSRLSPGSDIVGLDIVDDHIRAAERMFATERVRFLTADAISIPFADASFDALVSIESAQHFDTREAFLREAGRVLRNDGLLALTDIVLGEELRRSPKLTSMMRRRFQIPGDNLWSLEDYASRLEAIGYRAVAVVDMTERVIPPFTAMMRELATREAFRRRAGAMMAMAWSKGPSPVEGLRYLKVVARKSGA